MKGAYMRTKIASASLLLGLSICASAQLDVSIISQQKRSDGRSTVTLHVQNNSGKAVTAYAVALTVKKADGSTGEMGAGTNFGWRSNQSIKPGASYDEQILLNSQIVEVTPKLKAVVYADRTAVGDADAINNFARQRLQFATAMSQIAKLANSASTQANPMAAMSEAVQPAADPTHMVQDWMEELKAQPNPKSFIAQRLPQINKDAQSAVAYAQLRKVQ
jgi:hypothetical protein